MKILKLVSFTLKYKKNINCNAEKNKGKPDAIEQHNM